MGATIRWSVSLGALIIGLVSGPAGADVYRWVDAQGQVHFGDQPPADKEAQRVKIQPAPVSKASAPAAGSETKASEADPSEEIPASPRPDPAKQAKRCVAIRERIAYLETHPRVFMPEEKRWLVGDSHAAEIERLEGLLADECAEH